MGQRVSPDTNRVRTEREMIKSPVTGDDIELTADRHVPHTRQRKRKTNGVVGVLVMLVPRERGRGRGVG